VAYVSKDAENPADDDFVLSQGRKIPQTVEVGSMVVVGLLNEVQEAFHLGMVVGTQEAAESVQHDKGGSYEWISILLSRL
jgi:hypothetical protein